MMLGFGEIQTLTEQLDKILPMQFCWQMKGMV
jgi:hypothetical protein